MASKRLPVMTAAVAGLAMLSVAGLAAAAAGLAPAPAERGSPPPSHAPGGQTAPERGNAATANGPAAAATRDNPASSKAGDHTTGPDASGPARHGLCQAWSAGHGDVHGRRMDATAFEALVAAAGGADQVAAFCLTDAKRKPEPRDAAPPGRTPKTPPAPSGPPDRTDRGQGQGGPPTSAG